MAPDIIESFEASA